MVMLQSLLVKAKRIVVDRAGNLAIIGAFAMPVGLAAVGAALDVASVISTRAKLQAAADAGSVAAAAYLVNDDAATITKAKALAKSFVKGQIGTELSSIAAEQAQTGDASYDFDTCTSVDVTPTTGYGNAMQYEVVVKTCLEMQLSALNVLLGHKKETVSVSSTAESSTATQNAVSMYLVLDRSGSMSWDTTTLLDEPYQYRCGWYSYCTQYYVKKIDALKTAVHQLLNVINQADPDGRYSRMASISYNTYSQTPQNFAWGTSAVGTYVDNLNAGGGTDSSYAVKTAYDALKGTNEDTAHMAKNGQAPDKFIVFMTDGDNNYDTADTATKGWCDGAKSAGIEIYTVAFMAPDGGKSLLSYCASGADHYFEAEDADEMAAAFEYIGKKAANATARLTQ